MSAIPSPGRKLGPIRLASGVVPSQILVFTCVAISALCITVFLPMMQAYVFTEMLHVPRAEQGRLAGNLVTTQQIAVLLFVGFAGSVADRFGRKQVLAVATFGYAVCMFVYPLSTSVAMLFVLQFVYGLMSTGHITGTSAMITDYPANESRGKFVALMLLVQAAASAIFVGWIGARMPSWFVALGHDAESAGRLTFWVLGTLVLCGSLLAMVALRNPTRLAAPDTLRPGVLAQLRTAVGNLKLVVAEGRRNPRFGLVMTMGLVIRSDYFVMLSFVALWVTNAASTRGISTVEALKVAGLLALTFKLGTVAAQAVFGFVVDRVDRSRLLIVSLLVTGATLISTLLVQDVFGTGIYFVVAAIAVAESSLIVCGQAMLGQEAPVALRGSAVGIFYFTGTLGVVVMSFVAGLLFDRIGYAAPFVMVGLLNLVFAGVGALMILRTPASSAPKEELASVR